MVDIQDGRRSGWRSRALVLAALAAAAPLLGWRLGTPTPVAAQGPGGEPPPSARPVARSGVRALARLEPASGLITVGARPGSRIEQVLVAEGDVVEAGAVLAILEGHDQRQRQLALAEAQKQGADFRLQIRRDELKLERDRFDRLKQPRLDNLRGLVASLKEKTPVAGEKETKDAPGGLNLGLGGTEAMLREFSAGLRKVELAKAELELKELETNLELLDRRRALEDRQAAADSPERAVLDRQVELAKADIEQSVVHAPIAGRVLEVLAHRGEVSSGALLALGDARTMVATAEVFESDVLDIEVGAPAEVVILGRTVAGKVIRVGSLVGRNRIASLDPTAQADRRVVTVTIQLEDSTKASRLVSMQVEVSIRRRAQDTAAR